MENVIGTTYKNNTSKSDKTVGIGSGISDVYGKRIYSGQTVIFSTRLTKESEGIVDYDDTYGFVFIKEDSCANFSDAHNVKITKDISILEKIKGAFFLFKNNF